MIPYRDPAVRPRPNAAAIAIPVLTARVEALEREVAALRKAFADSKTKTVIVYREQPCGHTQTSREPGEARKCSKCGGVFPATEEFWYRCKSTKDGWHSWCRQCSLKFQKALYAKRKAGGAR